MATTEVKITTNKWGVNQAVQDTRAEAKQTLGTDNIRLVGTVASSAGAHTDDVEVTATWETYTPEPA